MRGDNLLRKTLDEHSDLTLTECLFTMVVLIREYRMRSLLGTSACREGANRESPGTDLKVSVFTFHPASMGRAQYPPHGDFQQG